MMHRHPRERRRTKWTCSAAAYVRSLSVGLGASQCGSELGLPCLQQPAPLLRCCDGPLACGCKHIRSSIRGPRGDTCKERITNLRRMCGVEWRNAREARHLRALGATTTTTTTKHTNKRALRVQGRRTALLNRQQANARCIHNA